MDATGRNPEFTPDVAGLYTLTVTDEETTEMVTLSLYGGTWRGVIDGEDSAGNPTVDSCDATAGCVYTPTNALCDDNDVCTGVETCDPARGCR